MPDYDGYTRSLEKILDGVSKDYWSSYIDINRHQLNVGKTYLWVAAALIGIYAAAYDKFHQDITNNIYLLILGGLSFGLTFLAFGICLYAIPARKGYRAIPTKGWGDFSREAYQLLKNDSKRVYASFLSSHISKIDHAFAHNFRTNKKRARLLRFTSWLLIGSFLSAILVASVVIGHRLTNNLKEVITMSEEDKPQGNESSSNESASLDSQSELEVPEPPASADIGGNTVMTHSSKPQKGTTIIMTEENQRKK